MPIDLKFEEQRGYYMLTKKTELEKRQLPSEFTNVSPKNKNIQFDSLDLCKKNAKLRHSLNEIYVLSFETVCKLVEDVRVYIGCLYKVCEGIAMLDMVYDPVSISDEARFFCTPNKFVRYEYSLY